MIYATYWTTDRLNNFLFLLPIVKTKINIEKPGKRCADAKLPQKKTEMETPSQSKPNSQSTRLKDFSPKRG